MRIFKGMYSLHPSRFKNPVVTIGVFDGFHLGHRLVVETLIKRAKRDEGESVVLTFQTHPKAFLSGSAPKQIMSLPHRLLCLERAGVDTCIVTKFDRSLAVMSSARFVEEVLISKIGVKGLVLGFDSSFGKNNEGNADFVRKNYPQIPVTLCDKVTVGGITPSSSLIRELIIAGKIKDAAQLLGHPVSFYGEVVEGSKRGAALGFPTANIIPDNEALPPAGVYGGETILADGSIFPSIVNVGIRPTFEDTTNTIIEVHILDFSRTLYGEKIEVELHEFIRKERKFKTDAELSSQIRTDIEKFKKMLPIRK